MTSDDVMFPTFRGVSLDLISLLGGGFKHFFIFIPKIGEDSNFDEHIFQMSSVENPGWLFDIGDYTSYIGIIIKPT